ncbi:hypothetical protein L1765_03715 [Microaerobacter geothermalis]|uniref:hypothetical protein n=1 Tax=Microaerobacter geothermalis TaxID=674972 RepID=UPI001F31708D|nr:hypothetical protein [Microaerobacter geothermalis]MCF6093101.1 hypothetical protein [Microaerobacter geothermalis]
MLRQKGWSDKRELIYLLKPMKRRLWLEQLFRGMLYASIPGFVLSLLFAVISRFYPIIFMKQIYLAIWMGDLRKNRGS